MREQFENMPEVHKKLKDLHPTIVWFLDQENKYASSFEGFQSMVIWLNGAWYAYQEQQKKLDCCQEENKAHLAKIDEAWNELDDRNSKEYIIEKLEKILKGKQDD